MRAQSLVEGAALDSWVLCVCLLGDAGARDNLLISRTPHAGRQLVWVQITAPGLKRSVTTVVAADPAGDHPVSRKSQMRS